MTMSRQYRGLFQWHFETLTSKLIKHCARNTST